MNLLLRNLDAKLVLALRHKAVTEQITVKQFLLPFLELAVNSTPAMASHDPITLPGVTLGKDLPVKHALNCRCFRCKKP